MDDKRRVKHGFRRFRVGYGGYSRSRSVDMTHLRTAIVRYPSARLVGSPDEEEMISPKLELINHGFSLEKVVSI